MNKEAHKKWLDNLKEGDYVELKGTGQHDFWDVCKITEVKDTHFCIKGWTYTPTRKSGSCFGYNNKKGVKIHPPNKEKLIKRKKHETFREAWFGLSLLHGKHDVSLTFLKKINSLVQDELKRKGTKKCHS